MGRVAMIFTGGTISMQPDRAAGGLVPSLDGAALIAATPGLGEIADLEPIDWDRVPASSLSLAQVLDIAGRARAALARPEVDGAVVVQGTDVMDETAFAYDLLLDGPKPVVVTGAMRSAEKPDADGPANLRAAVRVAAAPELRGQGVVVVMDGHILPADDVLKTHSTAVEAFQAVNTGALGAVDGGLAAVVGAGSAVRLEQPRGPRRRLARLPEAAVEPIPILTAHLGSDGTLLRLARRAGARGFVVAATGSGNTHPDLLAAAEEAMAADLPVILTSRCPAGGISPAYAFPGGGATWVRAGAINGGTLSPPKARLALALGLGAGLDRSGLASLLAGDGAKRRR